MQDKSYQNRQGATLVGPFTPEEAERLRAIRTHLYQNAEYLDRVLDEHRMKFARYLHEHGEISDEVA